MHVIKGDRGARDGYGSAETPAPALTPASRPSNSASARAAYGELPMSFEVNRGQADESADFVAKGAGYTLALSPAEAVLALAHKSGTAHAARRAGRPTAAMLRMKLVGADRSATGAGAEELEGKVNYFVGRDPAKWQTNVPTFGRVRYAGVYPGVDVVYYGNGRQLEYDFNVAPGGDARSIALRFDGADKVEVDAAGDLLLTLGENVIRQPKPVVYQEVDGARGEVDGSYTVGRDGRVGFAIGEYDAARPLVIDPVLVYSTFLGGSSLDDGEGIAVDSAGNVYVAGETLSTDFPTTAAVQGAVGGGGDVFVTKLNAAGTALVYSTYLGGSADEGGTFIALDTAGNAYLTGFTASTNFPTVNAFQSTYGGGTNDAFVTKINATGSALIYSTYLGGSNSDGGVFPRLAIDSAGSAYVTGQTSSTNFPTANALQGTLNGSLSDAFVTKLNASGTALVYSTYLGGSSSDNGRAIALDSSGNVYVTGATNSTNFPAANALQATRNGTSQDAFVTKLNASGTALVYSTYLGGSGTDTARGIAVDSGGSAYVVGHTFSNNFPTANAFQSVFGGGTDEDAFVTKLNASGTALLYSTYLGSTGEDAGRDIAVDSTGNAYVIGDTNSPNFPKANAFQNAIGGGTDAFVTKLNAAGTALVYSTYLGGSGTDGGKRVVLDSAGVAYVLGVTSSTCFPTTAGAFDVTSNGDFDAFISKLSETGSASSLTQCGTASTFQFAQAAYTAQEDLSFVTVTITRAGDTSAPATVDYATLDGAASERSDYTTALGTLRFAAGETSKTFDLLVNEDSRAEGTESLSVTLSNPTGGASLGAQSTAAVQIIDDAAEPSTNAIDDANVFVGQHYHDFLNRQADASGLAFWTAPLTACGADAACLDRKRTEVSQAFFLSIEFQQTGYLVFRFYKETFTDSGARPRWMPRYREFLRDTQEIGRGVVVGVGNWEQQLETNKQEFARRWVQSAEFAAQFPETMTAAQFVDKLFQNSEVTPTQSERDSAVAAFGVGNVEGRVAALRSVADSGSVYNRQFNPAFVFMQYVGYLRRNPNDAPEPGLNYAGFDFWLAKMNQFSAPGEDVRNEQVAISRAQRAEMVRAFIISTEYRGRFGQP